MSVHRAGARESEGTKLAPLKGHFVEGQHSGFVIAYPHHLGEARQEVQKH